MIFNAYRTAFLAAALLALTVTCKAQGKVSFPKAELYLESAGDPERLVSIQAELARSDAQRNRGLMFRKEVKDGEGMLFIYDRDEILAFWMKNTLVPLSIAFISAEGKILEIRDMEPGNLSPVTSSRSCRYALEAPQGWFSRAGIRPGDHLLLDNL